MWWKASTARSIVWWKSRLLRYSDPPSSQTARNQRALQPAMMPHVYHPQQRAMSRGLRSTSRKSVAESSGTSSPTGPLVKSASQVKSAKSVRWSRSLPVPV